MKMEWVREFKDPGYTAAFQRSCGVVSHGRVVSNNNNNSTQEGLEKFGAKGLNGVKNGYHLHERKPKPCLNGARNEYISNRQVNSDTNSPCKHKILTTYDGVQYSILNWPLYYIFKVGAVLGNEEFFFSFFPFVLWNLDVELGRKTALIWALAMYVGQAAKDIVLWPRPASPPVVRLETNHNGEHGMPSTHAIAGTIIPSTFFILVYHRYEINPYLCVWLTLIWALTVCLSRLYLGVHSVSDILCGAGGSLFLMVSFLPYLDACDRYMETHISAGFLVFTLGVTMCTVLYPRAKTQSSRLNATQVVMSSVGMYVGFWVLFTLGVATPAVHSPDKIPLSTPSLQWITLAAMRFMLGVVVMMATYLLVGKTSVRIISYLVGLPAPEKKHPSVRMTYTVITYFIMGLAISLSTPYMQGFPGSWRSVFLEKVL